MIRLPKKLRLIASIAVWLSIGYAYGKEVSANLYHTIHLAYGSYSIKEPSQERASQDLYLISYLAPFMERLRVGPSLLLVRDSKKQSQRLNVYDQHTIIGATVEYSYPKLLRFGFGLAPTLVFSETTYNFDGAEESRSRQQLGAMAQFALDYQVAELFEISALSAGHWRFSDDKLDWMFALRLGINMNAF